MKLHIFAKFSMVNLHMDPVLTFHLKISDVSKRDIVSKKGYLIV